MSLVDPIREVSSFACQAHGMGRHSCLARPRAVMLVTRSIRRLVVARRKDAPPVILMREGA